ncbi:MAG: cell division protein ZapA [Novosphingobium sp.]|nr:cell division protein ZapA [Novosphingobium sp.]MBX9644192.1 cell division protein ZapA [Novosphingobium sp.]
MSNVTLQIGGRSYLVACAAGEEERVQELGQMIEDKVRELGPSGHNETRLLLFAALLLADELHEARKKGGPAPTPDQADALEALAARLEKCASALES